MFGQMRSRARPLPPCPCGGSCRCHRPVDKMPLGMKVFFALSVPMIIFCAYQLATAPTPKRTIHVNGQVCDVVFVKTGQSCTSTGACHDLGYDEAVCPR